VLERGKHELAGLLGKGNQALGAVIGWLERVRENLAAHKR
jgi:oleate hydratase